MESLNIPNIKIKKANAINTYRNLRKIAALFRFFELFLFIMVVSRFTTQLPLAFRISADYFTGISLSLFTPGSVFLIGNAIVLILLFLSFSAGDKKSSNPPDDYYDDYVKRNRKISNFHPEMRLTQHKQTIKKQAEVIAPVEIKEQKKYEEKRKKIERSKSDKIIDRPEEKPVGRQLTRTLTETCRKVPSREDEMSNEEFQQKVEDFIARQQRQFFGSVKP